MPVGGGPAPARSARGVSGEERCVETKPARWSLLLHRKT